MNGRVSGGIDSYNDKTSSWMVRAVRGEQITNNFVDNGDGTVNDTKSGLMWQQVGADRIVWDAALTYCEKLEVADYGDWRLPNRNELQSLVEYSVFSPSIDTVAFPGSFSYYYWSSTNYASL
jgi:hypothetical protein